MAYAVTHGARARPRRPAGMPILGPSSLPEGYRAALQNLECAHDIARSFDTLEVRRSTVMLYLMVSRYANLRKQSHKEVEMRSYATGPYLTL